MREAPPKPPLVSAAMIVRNEARRVARCLASLDGLVDEIVVVDTGSTDGTLEICRDLGARVFEMAWQHDFSAARNAAIDRARGAWILYIDADEWVTSGDAARRGARALLSRRAFAACTVNLHAVVGYSAYRELRLFRSHPRIRFEGIIHENIWPSVNRYRAATFRRIGETDLIIRHDGYEGPSAAKHDRDCPMLLREVERDPTHTYCWYQLGLIEWERGNTDKARDAFHRVIEDGRSKWTPESHEGLAWAELVKLEYANTGAAAASELAEQGLRRFPDHACLLWLRAQLLMHDDSGLDEAATIYARLLGGVPDHRQQYGYDLRLFDELPNAGLAAIHFRRRRFADAARHFECAARCAPGNQEYRVKHALALKLAGQRDTGDSRDAEGLGSQRSPGMVADLEVG